MIWIACQRVKNLVHLPGLPCISWMWATTVEVSNSFADMGKRLKGPQKEDISTVVVERIRRRLRQNGFRCHITLQASSAAQHTYCCFSTLQILRCVDVTSCRLILQTESPRLECLADGPIQGRAAFAHACHSAPLQPSLGPQIPGQQVWPGHEQIHGMFASCLRMLLPSKV